MAKIFLVASTVFGFLSVALGAFGAHALKEKFDAYSMGVFQTGVQYQFFHAFALAFVGMLLIIRGENVAVKTAGWLFTAGIIIFSGSLYLLAFTGMKGFGAITPIGGLSFLMAWSILTVGLFRMPI